MKNSIPTTTHTTTITGITDSVVLKSVISDIQPILESLSENSDE